MLVLGEIVALATLVLLVYSLVDIIMSGEDAPHGLPKLVWLAMVLFLPLAGSVVWLVVSRRARAAAERAGHHPPGPNSPGTGRPAADDPRADAEFRRRIRERAEEQRRRARERSAADEEPGTEPPAAPAP